MIRRTLVHLLALSLLAGACVVAWGCGRRARVHSRPVPFRLLSVIDVMRVNADSIAVYVAGYKEPFIMYRHFPDQPWRGDLMVTTRAMWDSLLMDCKP